jgi:pimeloyl-ACP methyl ester carboxylesterase
MEHAHGLLPHWPGELVTLRGGDRVYVASTELGGNPSELAERLSGSLLASEPGGNDGAEHASVKDNQKGAGATESGARHPSPARTGAAARGPAAGVPPRAGERARVLCVHGMAGSTTNWTELMAQLAPDFACEAVDLPGAGWSPPPVTPRGYSARAMADVVIRLIEQRGHGPVHLIGNSLGGLISVKVAAARPELIRTLTLISPAMPDRLIRPSLARFPMIAVPGLGGWLLRKTDMFPPEARVWGVMQVIFYDPRAVHPQRVAEAVAEMARRDKLSWANDTLIGAARTVTAEYLRPARYSAWRDAERVRCPVLAIYGSHDKLVSPRMAGRAARAFRDSRVVVLPYNGHVAQMEHPQQVAAEFRALVRRAAPGPAPAASAPGPA